MNTTTLQTKNESYSFNRFMRHALKPLTKCVNFKGRSSREELISFVVLLSFVYFISNRLILMLLDEMPILAGTVALINIAIIFGAFIPTIALQIRRMHDQDKSGWWTLIPVIGLILLFMPGTKQENRFGPL